MGFGFENKIFFHRTIPNKIRLRTLTGRQDPLNAAQCSTKLRRRLNNLAVIPLVHRSLVD
jgi:hypothetical protein